MTPITSAQVEQCLRNYVEPHLESNLVDAKAIKDITIDGDCVAISVEMNFPCEGLFDQIRSALTAELIQLRGVERVTVALSVKIIEHKVAPGQTRIPNIKNIIAVASGKGGVGKSTTAANLALALSAEGAKVGLLDADIYGPSVPRMLGAKGKPESKDGKTVSPVVSHGLELMSIGFLIDEDQPMIWRGPMATGALQKLLSETQWGELDYLIVDMPPGTGDIQLTLSQKVPLSGAVIVTTPQDIALLDARKGLAMFEKVKVPILGIVENMSLHICSKCGHQEPIFGQGGGEAMSKDFNVKLLGQLPLSLSVRELADAGNPSVVGDPAGPEAEIYLQIARKIGASLALRGKDYSAKFPNIVIQNS